MGLVIGVQVVEHHAREPAFEAAQGFGLGVASGQAFAVVGHRVREDGSGSPRCGAVRR